jgi:hypothetical protein
MFSGIWTSVSGWKIKGISVGYILLVLIEKLAGLDVPGFEAGDAWVNEIILAAGIFAGRDTVKSITGK